ncbi:MAG: hypothetical protein J3K34DRAFT_77029 [Monoraphidium minutum]|nr:MAG: hypothetical protein J3K34DRAFT_77029 [Monoraphidium minutum]
MTPPLRVTSPRARQRRARRGAGPPPPRAVAPAAARRAAGGPPVLFAGRRAAGAAKAAPQLLRQVWKEPRARTKRRQPAPPILKGGSKRGAPAYNGLSPRLARGVHTVRFCTLPAAAPLLHLCPPAAARARRRRRAPRAPRAPCIAASVMKKPPHAMSSALMLEQPLLYRGGRVSHPQTPVIPPDHLCSFSVLPTLQGQQHALNSPLHLPRPVAA